MNMQQAPEKEKKIKKIKKMKKLRRKNLRLQRKIASAVAMGTV